MQKQYIYIYAKTQNDIFLCYSWYLFYTILFFSLAIEIKF